MENKLDNNAQPVNMAFNYKRNKEKALLSLKGILEGIATDGKLSETEILYLDVWLKSDKVYKNDGDFLDIRDLISDILEDGYVSNEEHEDLICLVNDVIKYGHNGSDTIDCLTNKLLGFLQGISSDGELSDPEIWGLKELLESNPSITENWPGDVIYTRLSQILEDNIIDEDERSDLLEMVKSISGQQFTDTGIAYGMATDFFSEDIILESIVGKKVCFTGKFLSGARSFLEKQANELGANVGKSVTKDLDYLIIGSLASRDWKFSSHGRKIESALKNKNNGLSTRILGENLWIELYSKIQ